MIHGAAGMPRDEAGRVYHGAVLPDSSGNDKPRTTKSTC